MNWLSQLTEKLNKTRQDFFSRVKDLFREGDLNDEFWEKLEELLLEADVGMGATLELVSQLQTIAKQNHLKDSEKLYGFFKEEVSRLLGKGSQPFKTRNDSATVILVVGVNGVGKTTTIGKLAMRFKSEGKKVFIAAADTFRAAAIDQLEVWTQRSGAELIKHREGSDPAAVAYDALLACNARRGDVLIVDTAGRLQTKTNLMEELRKIKRVLQKEMTDAPHETLLILDATTGQNALSQARLFKEAVDITGLILTKLDGSAKGGFALAVCHELNLPIRFIGVGESADDLKDFDAAAFAEALLGN